MTTLEKILKKARMTEMLLNGSEINSIVHPPKVFASVKYVDSKLQSYVSSYSKITFTFPIPWDMLEKEDITEEQIIDLSNGHNSISLNKCSEKFQNEVLRRMIAQKRPDECLFVDKYIKESTWDSIVVIPSVTCLEELEIMLDLENN